MGRYEFIMGAILAPQPVSAQAQCLPLVEAKWRRRRFRGVLFGEFGWLETPITGRLQVPYNWLLKHVAQDAVHFWFGAVRGHIAPKNGSKMGPKCVVMMQDATLNPILLSKE